MALGEVGKRRRLDAAATAFWPTALNEAAAAGGKGSEEKGWKEKLTFGPVPWWATLGMAVSASCTVCGCLCRCCLLSVAAGVVGNALGMGGEEGSEEGGGVAEDESADHAAAAERGSVADPSGDWLSGLMGGGGGGDDEGAHREDEEDATPPWGGSGGNGEGHEEGGGCGQQ